VFDLGLGGLQGGKRPGIAPGKRLAFRLYLGQFGFQAEDLAVAFLKDEELFNGLEHGAEWLAFERRYRGATEASTNAGDFFSAAKKRPALVVRA
jgi:hypothetical protein